jgi:hypothetical protein
VVCGLLDGVSKYQESKTITGIGQRARIVESEPTAQRPDRDLACDGTPRSDVLHHELDNIADHARPIVASFEYHPWLPSKWVLYAIVKSSTPSGSPMGCRADLRCILSAFPFLRPQQLLEEIPFTGRRVGLGTAIE